MTVIAYFLAWTLCLYLIHRAIHVIPYLREVHLDHHAYINSHCAKWHWNNLFLYNDTPLSTLDLWITEVIPTIIFSIITQQYWLMVFYYMWAALLQESVEHNIVVDIPILTSGKWHMMHHRGKCNYGLFLPLWDILLKTYKPVYVHVGK